MNLTLVRTLKAPDHTEGKLAIDGLFLAYTLERPDDGSNTPNQSAIPEGTYPVTKQYSPHFGIYVLAVENVPGRTDIEIHPANKVEQLKGCIAPGMRFMPDGFLSQSFVAFNALMTHFEHSKDPCTITIESKQETT